MSHRHLTKKINANLILNEALQYYALQCAFNKRNYMAGSQSKPNADNALNGIFPAVCTPFKPLKNEALSYRNLEKNLISWSTIPFSGYSVNGLLSEYPYLSNDERLEIIKMIRNIAEDGKKIISGSSSESLKKTIDICEMVKKSGADYSLISPPNYYKKQMTYLALLEYFTKLADKSPLPIILHNIPSVTFIDLPAELCIDLADHPNIVGLKECSHNIAKIACISEQCNKKGLDFSILAGSASFILDALRAGATGSINSLSCFLGPHIVKLYNLYLAEQDLIEKNYSHAEKTNDQKKQIDKLQLIQKRLIQPDLILNEYGVPGLKAALDLFGYYGGPCRSPLKSLTEEEINNLKLILEQNGYIKSKDGSINMHLDSNNIALGKSTAVLQNSI